MRPRKCPPETASDFGRLSRALAAKLQPVCVVVQGTLRHAAWLVASGRFLLVYGALSLARLLEGKQANAPRLELGTKVQP
eukprot:scaffold112581_cov63-Phaeocystis_antarctica.AAC.2